MSYILGSSASAENCARNMSWSLNGGEIAAPRMVPGGARSFERAVAPVGLLVDLERGRRPFFTPANAVKRSRVQNRSLDDSTFGLSVHSRAGAIFIEPKARR